MSAMPGEPSSMNSEIVPVESAPLEEEEIKARGQIEKYFADKGVTIPEVMLIKFLRGYSYEKDRIKASIDMLEKTLKFRGEHNVDNLIATKATEADEFQDTTWPFIFHGRDKHGHPVYYERTGKIDPERLLGKYTWDEICAYHLVMLEQLEGLKANISKETGHLTYKHIVVLDMSGFGYRHCSKKFYDKLKEIIHIDQYYYPESLFRLYIINAPAVFKILWSVVKAWLHPITRERISVCRSNFIDELRKWIADDQIPANYGGSCTISDCPCRNAKGSFVKGPSH
eukprot:199296_1